MAYLDWSDALSVGIASIDQQHQRLVSLVNELHSAMMKGRGEAILGTTINALATYTVTHFENEERYFAEHGYPAAASHHAEHAAFIERVADFQQGFAEGRILMTLDVLSYLGDWLVDHIQGSDKAFAPFLAERGVA